MNKILFLISFFAVVVFCFPAPALGAVMELTVTITSLQSPQRAAMALLPVNTEFGFKGSRVVVVGSDGSVKGVNADTDYYCPYYCQYQNKMQKGSVKVISFPYDATMIPYNVYAEVGVTSQRSYYTLYKADCTLMPPVQSGPGWYYFGPLYYNNFVSVAYCPNPPATISGYAHYIAVDPANVINYYSAGSSSPSPYWRLSSLFTITSQ